MQETRIGSTPNLYSTEGYVVKNFGYLLVSQLRLAPAAGLLSLALALMWSPAALAQVRASVVLQDGDVPQGVSAPVSTISPPFINGGGRVGFAGSLTDGERFIWLGDGIRWLNSDEDGVVLGGAEAAIGISDDGGFIYSPTVDGDDAVYTHNGVLLVDGDPAPGFSEGVTVTFNSRPNMTNNGRTFWIAGVNEGGGTATNRRVMYTASDASPATIEIALAGGDIVDGLAIENVGIDFSYQTSGDGNHIIQTLDAATGSSSNDSILVVDGNIIARESFPVSGTFGEAWQSFDDLSINNAGNFLFSGDTDSVAAKDEFVAYKSSIAMRESDTVDGIDLVPGSAVRAVSLNNLDQAMVIWAVGATEMVFFACDAADMLRSARVVLRTGDIVDLNGDGLPDATITDFNASATTSHRQLTDDGRVYLEVDLDYGDGIDLEAIIQVNVSCGS
jgi:hypothetical protein